MMRSHRGIILLLIFALVLRIVVLLLATELRENSDILRWKDWGRIAFLYGFADTYTPDHLSFGTYPNNMPPGTLYVVSAMYWVWLQAGKILAGFGIAPGSNAWVNVVLLRIFLTIPSLFADLGIGFLMYRFSGLFASALFMFNPVVLFNSVFWGQMDAINNLFVLLAIWLLTKKQYIASYVSFAISLLVKFSLLFFAPLFFLVNKKRIFGAIAMVLTMIVFVLPISRSPLGWFFQYVTHHATGEMTNVTAFAFNLWWVIFRPTIMFGPSGDLTKVVDVWLSGSSLTQTMYGPLSLGVIALGVSALFQLPVYVWFLRRKLSIQTIVTAFAALSILSFLTLPQMHERYLYPAIVPLAVLVGFGIPVLYELVILSFMNFINIVIVWHPMPLPVWIFELMRHVWFQWWVALVTTATGFWTVWKLLRKK